MKLERVALIAAKECIRQKVGIDRLSGLIAAFGRAEHQSVYGNPDLQDVIGPDGLACLIEPSNAGKYRMLPVTFADMSTAIPANNVQRAIDQLFDNVPNSHGYVTGYSDSVEHWINDFLDIHPFSDGNGRMAWILRTWLLKQWDNPEELPDYYRNSNG